MHKCNCEAQTKGEFGFPIIDGNDYGFKFGELMASLKGKMAELDDLHVGLFPFLKDA